MSELSISKAWDETKALLSRDGKLFASVALALLVLPQAALGAFAPQKPEDITALFFAFLIIALVSGLIGQIALNRLALPPSTTVGAAINRGVRAFIPLFIAFFAIFILITLLAFSLAFIAVLVGIVAPPTAGSAPPLSVIIVFMVPFLVFWSIFQLMMPLAASGTNGLFDLIKGAWTLAKGNFLRLFGFLIIVILGMFGIWMTAQVVFGSAVVALFGPTEPGSLEAFLLSLAVGLAQSAWTVVTAAMLARIFLQLDEGGHTPASAANGESR